MSDVLLTIPGSGSWTPPDLYGDGRSYLVTASVLAAGAGGQGLNNYLYLDQIYAVSGGAGERVESEIEVTPNVDIDYYIGAKGIGGTSTQDTDPASLGSDGEDSWLVDTSTLYAHGGTNGDYTTIPPYGGGWQTPGIGTIKHKGGTGCGGSSGGGTGGGAPATRTHDGDGDHQYGGINADGTKGGCGDGPECEFYRPEDFAAEAWDSPYPGGGGGSRAFGSGGNGGDGEILLILPTINSDLELDGNEAAVIQGVVNPSIAISMR